MLWFWSFILFLLKFSLAQKVTYTYEPSKDTDFPIEKSKVITENVTLNMANNTFFTPVKKKMKYVRDEGDGIHHNHLSYYAVLIRMDKIDGENTEDKIISTGVFIDYDRIITNYIPYKKIMKKAYSWDIVVVALREFENKRYQHLRVTCARPVVPFREEDLTDDQFFGVNKSHTPVHDLMVMQVAGRMRFFSIGKGTLPHHLDDVYDENLALLNVTSNQLSPDNINDTWTWNGPILSVPHGTNFAVLDDVQILSLGFESLEHLREANHLKWKAYDRDEFNIANCYEYMPKDWGYFLCVNNMAEKFPGINAGSILMHRYNAFGIGAFMIERNNNSLLVFTDMRFYKALIDETCTDADNPDRHFHPFVKRRAKAKFPVSRRINKDNQSETKWATLRFTYNTFLPLEEPQEAT